jgi:hypothetical protein
MTTLIQHPHRYIVVHHSKNLRVSDGGIDCIIAEHTNSCNTCYPQIIKVLAEGDLIVELHTEYDGT